MDSLLCDEVWLREDHHHSDYLKFKPLNNNYYYTYDHSNSTSTHYNCMIATKEDWRQAFSTSMKKERTYMPDPGYKSYLQSSFGLVSARSRAIHWLVKSRSRLDLSCQTIFNAANYMDRFLSMNQCQGWKCWMVELLAVACLSVASKLGETTHLPFHEIQMEDLDHSFEPSLIQRMELRVLEVLDWRLGSVTSYSYVELLLYEVDSFDSFVPPRLIDRVIHTLFASLSDGELVEFRPSVIAISALSCAIEEALPTTDHDQFSYVTTLIPKDQEDYLAKCYKIMKANTACQSQNVRAQMQQYPASPVTVLAMQRLHISHCHVDLSFFQKKIPTLNLNLKPSNTKRKREEES